GQHEELERRAVELADELQELQKELQPVEQELELAEERRMDLLAERQAVEQRLTVLRAAERAALEAREARHVAAQRAADEVDRLNTEIDETAEHAAELSGEAAWDEQLRLGFEEAAEPHQNFDIEAARRR